MVLLLRFLADTPSNMVGGATEHLLNSCCGASSGHKKAVLNLSRTAIVHALSATGPQHHPIVPKEAHWQYESKKVTYFAVHPNKYKV